MSTEESTSEQRPRNSGSEESSSSDCFLVVCTCFSVVTSLAAILCITVNVLSAIRSFSNGLDLFDGIFRCYAIVMAIFVIVAETEWRFLTQFFKILEYWAGRGMLQIFVAVMTRAYPEDFWQQQKLVLLQNLATYLLLACGVVYFISGFLCIGKIKRSHQKRDLSREQAAKNLKDLDRQREELEALLIGGNV